MMNERIPENEGAQEKDLAQREWVYYDPEFECDRYHSYIYQYSPWSGLRHFAYDLVCWFGPRRIAELGSHYGCSSFAFLQALKDSGSAAEFYAADTWEGDDFTGYAAGEDVRGQYQYVQESCFGGQNASMLCGRFGDLCGNFADGSIDLLHIDGSHWYEDVKEDYEMWKPKMSARGIILLHDVGEDLFDGRILGSCRYWKELLQTEPRALELPFSGGLGIVFMDGEVCRLFREKVDVSRYQQKINQQDMRNKARVRELSYELKEQDSYIRDLQDQMRIKEEHLARYASDMAAKDVYIRRLEHRAGGHRNV